VTLLGVVGSGTMGAGIAQVAAQQGMQVVLWDLRAELVEAGLDRIRASLQRNVERGRMAPADADSALARIRTATDFSGLAQVDAVIEAVLEDIATKAEVFRRLDAGAPQNAILATNTSSLSVTEIAAATRRPDRVVGMHFFNPVPAMALVEVVRGNGTSLETMDRAVALARDLGKTPVRAEDTPGFIVNRIVRPFYNEALRILNDGIAPFAEIDRVMKGVGFRMGPFELMDLIGNDVNFAVTSSIYEGLFQEPRFRPSFLQQRLVQSGNLGQKTGRGWYSYPGGARPESTVSSREGGPNQMPPLMGPVVVVADGPLGVELAQQLDLGSHEVRLYGTADPALAGRLQRVHDLGSALEGVNLVVDATLFADAKSRLIREWNSIAPQQCTLASLALVQSTTELASSLLNTKDLCGFGYVPPLADTRIIEVAPGLDTSEAAKAAVLSLVEALGKDAVIVDDGVGLVGPRIVSLIVNEAAQALMEGVASAADIDAAVKLGANYPHGPLEWADAIGLDTVYAIIKGLQEEQGEDRYRPSRLLRKMVMAGWTGHAAGRGFTVEG